MNIQSDQGVVNYEFGDWNINSDYLQHMKSEPPRQKLVAATGVLQCKNILFF